MVPGLLLLLLAAPGTAALEAEAKAKEALAAGRLAEALDQFETALRLADTTAEKARLRDAYRASGWAEPRPVSQAEGDVVVAHIRAEKVRVWRAEADRLEREEKLCGAILLRKSLQDLFASDGEGVKEEQARIEEIVRKLTRRPTAEEKVLAEKMIRAAKDGEALLQSAKALFEKRELRLVVRLCQELEFGSYPQEARNGGRGLREQAEAAAAAGATPVERDEVRAILDDERFRRLDAGVSRHFLFVGPRAFVASLPNSEKTLLDLAYIFQSDLAGQPLTHDGVRICLYYQETFDFGGGLAGGKLIRIGNRAIGLPVAGMLHYHELGHCIFGRGWLHDGFTEGLADFAAGFSLDALGQTDAARSFITESREQFVRFFLGRKVPYFQIQPYRPAAGFLFSQLPPGDAPYDWAPYRRVFHRMREAQFGAWPEREHQLMRYFGYLLATEYGEQVFDTLAEWGFPVSRKDWREVLKETEELITLVRRGEFFLLKGQVDAAEEPLREALALDPRSTLASRARHALLRIALARGEEESARALDAELGIVRAFRVVGPFHARGRTAHVVFPPETRIEPGKEVRYGIEAGMWRDAVVSPDGTVDLLTQGFGYPENACAFALTYLRAEEELPARLCIGSDDGHAVWFNGALVEKTEGSHPFRLDDHLHDVLLRKGWNRLLLKVHNTGGAWGFLLRVEGREGAPIPGLRADAADHEGDLALPAPVETRAVGLVNDEFKSLSPTRWRTGVGRFDTQNGRLRPLAAERGGLWQRFVVDPDKPKDGPSNILWLAATGLPAAPDFEIELVAVAEKKGLPAKFGITVDGEGENDGQSGHTFVLHEEEGNLACSWYRYDRLLYLQPGAEVAEAAEYRLRLRRVGSTWWLLVNDLPLFDGVDAAPLPAFGIGILTWGPAPPLESFRMARLERSRR
ncbi:MAG: hypothetical protein ACT4PV_00400 [Planctomycetaceae bacterium]